jgi:hypothetical protein
MWDFFVRSVSMVVICLILHCPNFPSFRRIAALSKLFACKVHLLIFNYLCFVI